MWRWRGRRYPEGGSSAPGQIQIRVPSQQLVSCMSGFQACLDAHIQRWASQNGTSRECSWKCLRGLACAGAATSQTLMLPSPHEDTRMFSFSCVHRKMFFHSKRHIVTLACICKVCVTSRVALVSWHDQRKGHRVQPQCRERQARCKKITATTKEQMHMEEEGRGTSDQAQS